jgi:hypothetical protein
MRLMFLNKHLQNTFYFLPTTENMGKTSSENCTPTSVECAVYNFVWHFQSFFNLHFPWALKILSNSMFLPKTA